MIQIGAGDNIPFYKIEKSVVTVDLDGGQDISTHFECSLQIKLTNEISTIEEALKATAEEETLPNNKIQKEKISKLPRHLFVKLNMYRPTEEGGHEKIHHDIDINEELEIPRGK